MNTHDCFYNEVELKRKDRKQLWCILIVCFANFVVMLSIAFGCYWWSWHIAVVIIAVSVYVFVLASLKFSGQGRLFSAGFMRENDRNNCSYGTESIPIKYGVYLRDRDFIVLNDDRHLRLSMSSVFYAKDIDMNSISCRDVVLSRIDNGREVYRYSCDCYNWIEVFEGMDKFLKSHDLYIDKVYNEYGDLKWMFSNYEKRPSLFRKNLHIFTHVLFILISFFIALAPVVVMTATRNIFRTYKPTVISYTNDEVNDAYLDIPEGWYADDACFVCLGSFSNKYHCDEYCHGLRQCEHGIKTVSIEEAIDMDRKPCGYCYKCVQDKQYEELMKLKDFYKKRYLSMDKLGQLYYALKADGAIQHLSEDEFRRWMQDESNSRKLYDALKADGSVTSDTYEIFADRLGLGTQTSDSLNIKK